MTHLLAFNPLSAGDYISAFGAYAILGVLAITFAETGLLIGFFLPGDSLLFIAGFMTLPNSKEHLALAPLLIGAPICAILGAQLGHYLGLRFGRRLFDKPDSRLFKQEYVERAEYYFNDYGAAKAILLARFIPIVRTFMNPVAGVLEVPARTFFVYNAIGGVVWTEGVLIAGHLVGSTIPASKVDTYVIPITLLIVLLSAIPVIKEVLTARKDKREGRGPAVRDERPVPVSSGGPGRHKK
ncbi:DedA family protein [Actinocrinis puniceicyclus]|uniref:DedA family protein n=1 Tax=Actinocrinis puniceicyclus TaxID=977794 RepID=A0A8J8BAK1_9ACTN|nr:DedA family protein [Actinocrinis puniceicyclus]MBS2962138.1 DedA family protein [Actinocrinis puniceicyclus]